MSQVEVLQYLKRVRPKYKLVREIGRATKISYGALTTNLRRLHNHNFVKRKYIPKQKSKYMSVVYKYNG